MPSDSARRMTSLASSCVGAVSCVSYSPAPCAQPQTLVPNEVCVGYTAGMM